MMFLSLRFLTTRKKQSFFILLGIVIGTAAYVAISGMMLGFQLKLLDQLVNNESHIRLSAREDLLTPANMGSYPEVEHVFWNIPPSGRKDSAKIEFPISWFDRLDHDENVLAYTPQVNMNVIFKRGKINLAGKMVGTDPARQVRVTNIEKYMVQGAFKDLGNSGNRIIIGRALMQNIGARLSETLLVSSGNGEPRPFKIVGIFETGVQPIDETTTFASLTDAQQLRGAPSEITDIAVKLKDPYVAPTIAASWRSFTLEKVIAWQEASASILSVFRTQDVVRNSMTIAIIVVAGFGIFNILSILVNQKRKDIAILRSMGYLPSDILKLFFNQGFILGIVGGFLGLIFGFILCRIVGSIPIESGRIVSSSGTMLVSYDWIIYVKAFFIALLSSTLSSIIPAREAGKLEPMDIIRSGGQV